MIYAGTRLLIGFHKQNPMFHMKQLARSSAENCLVATRYARLPRKAGSFCTERIWFLCQHSFCMYT